VSLVNIFDFEKNLLKLQKILLKMLDIKKWQLLLEFELEDTMKKDDII
jgi:hypothetical protein